MAELSETFSTEKNKIEKGALYLVATPIGNLDDITLRALKILRECDFVAAEDSRVSAKLLSHYDIQKPIVVYQKFNTASSGEKIAVRLKNGESCALVTDAGTPGISDPGQEVASLCVSLGIKVYAVPGACACVTALVSSGFDTSRFVFVGFPGAKQNEMEKSFETVRNDERTSVFYEAPHRLKKTLEVMEKVLGSDRKIALCRELTKLNEEIIRLSIGEANEKYEKEEPRGEYVVVVDGCREQSGLFFENMTVAEHVNYYIGLGLDKMSAIKAVAKDRRVPKNDIYKEFI